MPEKACPTCGGTGYVTGALVAYTCTCEAGEREWDARFVLLNDVCDRCKKFALELHAFRLSEAITYRRRVIEKPWLCRVCMRIEKEKWWKAQEPAPMPAAGEGVR